MILFVIKRLGIAIPTLLALIVFSFVLMHIAPGNPFAGEKNLLERRDEQHQCAVRARQALLAAVDRIRLEHRCTFRFRAVVQVQGPLGQRHHCAGLPGDADVWLLGLHPRIGDRHRARGVRGGAAEQLARLSRSRRYHRRAGAPQLRAGADPAAHLHPLAALAPGRRLERRTMELCGPAGDRAGDHLPRQHRANYALVDAGGAQLELHPHGAGQGAAGTHRDREARPEAGAAAGDLLSGSGVRRHDHRLGGGRRVLCRPAASARTSSTAP